jgi:hypothetical protein
VSGIAREVDVVKEMTALVAEPLVMDELSLIRACPVRVQGRCRNLLLGVILSSFLMEYGAI